MKKTDAIPDAVKEALRKGEWPVIEAWIFSAGGIDVKTDREGKTLLHLAAAAGRVEIMKRLIDIGMDVDVRDRGQCTPLHDAVNQGKEEAVFFLLVSGAQHDARNGAGKMPLNLCGSMHRQIFILLANPPGWVMGEKEEVIRKSLKDAGRLALTEIFNFREKTYLLTVRNLHAGGGEAAVFRTFSELAGTELLKTAEEAFVRKGGVLPEPEIKIAKPKLYDGPGRG